VTVFVLGSIIIGGVIELVEHCSPQKPYMGLVGFAIGIVWTLLFTIWGRDV
jgi:hypothetical protein